MKAEKYAKRYAKMFLNSVGLDAAPGALKELAIVNSLMDKSPEVKNFLLSPMFSEAERAGALKALGARLSLSEGAVKFLNYLSAAGAATALGRIIDAAVAIYSEKKRKARAKVITATAIGEEYKGRVRDSLGRITQRDVEVEYETDPSLLGGMLIKVGSVMYDGSVEGQLRLLKEELVKG
jgi:ATP synthase F1 delta subunit